METKSGDGEVVDLTEARSDRRAPAGAVLGAGEADHLVLDAVPRTSSTTRLRRWWSMDENSSPIPA